MFNAKLRGDYQYSVPLYLEDENGKRNSKPYVEIKLTGSAAKPKVLFDRRELIL
jgi:hypothetical protein